ncbi:MAG TPA: signal peptidase II [bacterium]|nr:signal peptidase II [bacterium]
MASAIVLADQAVKALVGRLLPLGDSVPLIPGIVALTHVRNTGIAFGMAGGVPVAVPGAIALTFLFLLFYNRPRWTRPPLARAALALLAGGAVGNLVDRVRVGAVIDYLDVFVWPVFNLADLAVTTGSALLILALIPRREPEGAASRRGARSNRSD